MLVDDGLEVFYASQSFEYNSNLVSCQATVAEENTIHFLVINILAGLCDALALPLTQHIILQAKRLAVYFFKDRQ